MKDSIPCPQEEKPFARLSAEVEHPLWLLQKEDTTSLAVSFFLSAAAHAALFVVLAATRIFHPFAGASTQFELLWLSISPSAGTEDSQPAAQPAAVPPAKTAPTTPVKAPPNPEPERTAKQVRKEPAPAAEQPVKTPPIAEETPSAAEVKETETVIAISRYRGKVVDILEKKEEVPTFKVFSSVAAKSEGTKAEIREIVEERPLIHAATPRGEDAPKKAEASVANGTPAGDAASAAPLKSVQGHLSSSTVTASAGTLAPAAEKRTANGLLTASADSGTTAPSSGKPTPRENGNGGNATPGTPSAAPSAGKAAAGEAGKGVTASAGPPSGTAPQAGARLEAPAPSAPKVEHQEAKPSAPAPANPPPLLHPPVTGDLKLIITCDGEVGVEAVFKEFRKARRGKPMSRKEWLRKRQVMPKVVKTKEKVNEAVLETTDEGIYELIVKSADGKPVKAAFVLKIHESAPGARTRNLGERTIAENTAVALVLMPEGILWDDDDSFTGNMEDSESVTKFQAETGLVWKEYK